MEKLEVAKLEIGQKVKYHMNWNMRIKYWDAIVLNKKPNEITLMVYFEQNDRQEMTVEEDQYKFIK